MFTLTDFEALEQILGRAEHITLETIAGLSVATSESPLCGVTVILSDAGVQ